MSKRTYEEQCLAIRAAIEIGIHAEDDGEPEGGVYEYDETGFPLFNPFGPVDRSLTEKQIDWIASWLASEGFGKL